MFSLSLLKVTFDEVKKFFEYLSTVLFMILKTDFPTIIIFSDLDTAHAGICF